MASYCDMCPLITAVCFLFWLTTQPETLRASIPADVPTQLAERLREPALQGIKGTWLADGSVTLSGHCASSSMMEPLQHFYCVTISPFVTIGV